MTTKLNNQFYFVAPLEVVKVTKDNLEEAAQWCGGRVAEVKSRTVEGRMDSYVWVPTPKGTKMSWAFPGMFITRRIIVTLKNELAYSYQVYKRDYFEKNYFGLPNEAVEKTWERADAEKRKAKIEQIAKARKPNPAIDLATLMGTKVPGKDVIETEKLRDMIIDAPPVASVLPTEDFEIAQGVTLAPDDSQSLGGAVALVEQELGGEVIFEHNHISTESCDSNGCTTERFSDGEHRFTDLTVTTCPTDVSPVYYTDGVPDIAGVPDHADGTGSVENHVSKAVEANEAAAEEGP